jgi:hypothetical protein
MKNINDHITQNQNILENPLTSSQQRRHVEEELGALVNYKDHHPEDDHDPTTLELFCDVNPHAKECKVFDV